MDSNNIRASDTTSYAVNYVHEQILTYSLHWSLLRIGNIICNYWVLPYLGGNDVGVGTKNPCLQRHVQTDTVPTVGTQRFPRFVPSHPAFSPLISFFPLCFAHVIINGRNTQYHVILSMFLLLLVLKLATSPPPSAATAASFPSIQCLFDWLVYVLLYCLFFPSPEAFLP